MSNPIPEGADRGDLVTVPVTGRLRTSVDGAVTLDVPDVQEPVLRLPWVAVEGVPAVAHAETAYDWAVARRAPVEGASVDLPTEPGAVFYARRGAAPETRWFVYRVLDDNDEPIGAIVYVDENGKRLFEGQARRVLTVVPVKVVTR